MKSAIIVLTIVCMFACLSTAQIEPDLPPFQQCLRKDVWNRCIECPEGYGSNGNYCPRKCLESEGCECDYSCEYLNENEVCVFTTFKPYVGPQCTGKKYHFSDFMQASIQLSRMSNRKLE